MEYQRVATSGTPTEDQQYEAAVLKQEASGWTEATLLADGRYRVYQLNPTGVIECIVFIAPDGSTTTNY